jgi:hypothetical protein
MGQVIQLPHVESAVLEFERVAPRNFSNLSAEQIQKAISSCGAVQRQIEILLRIAVKADKMIDNVPNASLQRCLREKRARSHVELLSAHARVSSTIAALTEALATDEIVWA